MRDVSEDVEVEVERVGVVKDPVVESYVLFDEARGARRIDLLMYESAIVSAPAVIVAGLDISEGFVEEMRARRLDVSVCSMCANGRYLLGSSGGSCFVLLPSTPFDSCSSSGNEGVGYSH